MTFVFDFGNFNKDCGLVYDHRTNQHGVTDKNGLYAHVDAWKAALLYAHDFAMKAVGRECRVINPHLSYQREADRIRILEIRSHREATRHLLRVVGSLEFDQNDPKHWMKSNELTLLGQRLDAANVVPTKKAFPKSTYEKVWDEVYEYATTDKVFHTLGMQAP